MSAERWSRRACAVVVAAVAAYASYEHQRTFALRGGADRAGAALWPLSVDGLLLLATMGRLKPGENSSHRTRRAVRLAFVLGIAISLAANVAAAPRFTWQPVLVAGWPPVALLLAVELLAQQGPSETGGTASARSHPAGETPDAPDREPAPDRPGVRPPTGERSTRKAASAEQRMWDYYLHQRERGALRISATVEVPRRRRGSENGPRGESR
nr:DUF2637 domain-containing protein [Streptomyces sp. NRRL F-5123]